MRNITVTVSDAVYRNARVWAARRDTSVSATVQFVLENLPALGRAIRVILDAELTAFGIVLPPINAQASAAAIESEQQDSTQTPRLSAAKLCKGNQPPQAQQLELTSSAETQNCGTVKQSAVSRTRFMHAGAEDGGGLLDPRISLV
jgi:hypothetical protein